MSDLKKHPKHRTLTTAEFLKSDFLGRDVTALLKQFNGGSFMDCHRLVYEKTGIWVEELVPVFQRMDAAIITRDLRPA